MEFKKIFSNHFACLQILYCKKLLHLAGSHGGVSLDGEGETSSGEVNYDMLGLLELRVIVDVQDDAVRQRQRLRRALARFHHHHGE